MRLVSARMGVFVTGLEIAKKYMAPWNLVGIPVKGLSIQQFRIAYRDIETLPLCAQRLVKHLATAHPQVDELN
jgi:hypothetical protein